MNDKFVIWASEVNINDWKDRIKECFDIYKEQYHKEDYTESFLEEELEKYFAFALFKNEEPTFEGFFKKFEDSIYEEVDKLNTEYLGDEIMNLDVETEGKIICIADIGRWNGRVSGYSYEGNNISSCLHGHVRGDSDIEFYVQKEGRTLEFKATEWHHDGTNFYTYRELKPNLSDTQIANFENKLYNGEATKSDIGRYTLSLGEKIQKVYGFELDNKKQKSLEGEK